MTVLNRLMRLMLIMLTHTATVTIGAAQCVSDTVQTDCGNTSIFFDRQQYDSISPFTLVHVHENETTALQAAQWLLDSVRHGSLVTWRVQQQRFVDFSLGSKSYHFDPNRIYSADGLAASLGTMAPDTVLYIVQAVADTFVRSFVLGKTLVVAVHNNTNGGGLSVKSYARGGIYFNDASAIYINAKQDADDFFYTTDERIFKYLKSSSFNTVLQNNEQVTEDGSLSVFCSRHGIPYVNIEAENGHLYQQKKMLQQLVQFIQMQD